VKIVSVTDGRCGHHQIAPDRLVAIRRSEAHTAGASIGAEYETWDFPDGSLQANLQVREAIIRQVRKFEPDLLLTHRLVDYHPDHRAVSLAVQDACYLVTVPHVCPDQPALRRDPTVAFMADLFTRPNKLRADVLLDVSAEFPSVVQMLACHRSQFFQWLPYHDDLQVPNQESQQITWLANWISGLHRQRCQHFAEELAAAQIPPEPSLKLETYEISEYGQRCSNQQLAELFPGYKTQTPSHSAIQSSQ
jgi:LmbE family N-acetylglucosaminyl deacetylase